MKKVTTQEYLLRKMKIMLGSEIVVESAYEHYQWPTDPEGNPVTTVPAGRFEFYICARTAHAPDGLTPATDLPLEILLKEHAPQMFDTNG